MIKINGSTVTVDGVRIENVKKIKLTAEELEQHVIVIEDSDNEDNARIEYLGRVIELADHMPSKITLRVFEPQVKNVVRLIIK